MILLVFAIYARINLNIVIDLGKSSRTQNAYTASNAQTPAQQKRQTKNPIDYPSLDN